MKISGNHPQGGMENRFTRMSVALIFVALMLSACGGGTGTASTEPPLASECIPGDPATADQCGTLIIGLTDGDGDFLSYTVDVLSLTLEKADGATIEVLPNSTRIDFASYVDLTEFISVTNIPPGVYVAGTIQLDYNDAEVFVEAGDQAKETVVVDADGNPVTRTELKIMLSDRDQLFVSRGRTALMTLDFDLDASHMVDIDQTPAVARAEPFIVAELNPVDSKEIRVRGRFIEANEAEMYYVVALRPFYDRVGDFGRVKVHVTSETDFEVND